MPDTYRSPASLAPINNKKKMAQGKQLPVESISMIGGGRSDSLMSFQAGMSVGLMTEGV